MTFLVGCGQWVYGQVQNCGPWTVAGVIFMGAGVLLLGLVFVRRRLPSLTPKPLADPRLDAPAKVAVRDELVAAIEDGKSLAPDAIKTVRYGPYAIWRDKTAAFLESVFGTIERQRFDEPYGPPPATLERNLADRLKRLAGLRDRPRDWTIQVNAEGLRKASQERRHRSVADQIVEAESRREDSAAPGQRSSLKEGLLQDQLRGRRLRPQLDDRVSRALGRSPSATVDHWAAEVSHRLEAAGRGDLVDRFCAAREPTTVASVLAETVRAKQRLDAKLAELTTIIREL